MLEVLTRIAGGKGREGDIEFLEELGLAVKDASMCGLGTTLPNPVLSTIRYFRDEYEAHIREKRCPALVCKDLIIYHIIPEKCVGCTVCLKECSVGAIKGQTKFVHIIDQSKCTKCGTCLDVCPPKISAVVKLSGEDIKKAKTLDQPISVKELKKKTA
jgi:NADH-quinone oxidoreductase subunit F